MYVFIRLNSAPFFASCLGRPTITSDFSEVESLALIGDDDRNFAGSAPATDVHFYLSFLVSVHDGVCQSFPECQFYIRFFTGNTL
jgi:hypothetical protein